MTYTGTPETAEAYRFAVNYGRKWNRRMGEMLDSDEVAGIAGETVARHLPDYNPDLHPNWYAWLARRVQHACLGEVRSRYGRDRTGHVTRRYKDRAYVGRDYRRTFVPFDPNVHDRADSYDVALEVEVRQIGEDFVRSLPRQQREVVEARMAGAQGAEIGERWGVSPTRISQIMRDVRSRYHSWAGAGA